MSRIIYSLKFVLEHGPEARRSSLSHRWIAIVSGDGVKLHEEVRMAVAQNEESRDPECREMVVWGGSLIANSELTPDR